MRKISANYVFDGIATFYKNGVLHLDDKGVILSLQAGEGGIKETEGVEFYNGILTPGFVNCHCHLELSHLRGLIPPGTGLPLFISSVSSLRNVPEDAVIKAMNSAIAEMIANGIVAVGDVSNNELSFPLKECSSSICFTTFVECYGLSKSSESIMYDKALGLHEKWKDRISLSITPHAAYTCSPWLLGKIEVFAEKYNNVFSFHNQETESENTLFIQKKGELFDTLSKMNLDLGLIEYEGLNSLQTTSKYFPDNNNKLLVHNTYTTQSDIDYLKEGFDMKNFYWCFCPRSNKFIENQLPHVDLFVKNNLNCVVGTDSLSSNTSLSILEELKILSSVSGVKLQTLLSWACIMGAKALKMDGNLGSFDRGKRPGVNLIENVDLQNMCLLGSSNVRVLV